MLWVGRSVSCLGTQSRGVEHTGYRFQRSEEYSVSGNNKRGREVRKPKQPAKPKPAKQGTDLSRVQRQEKLPRAR